MTQAPLYKFPEGPEENMTPPKGKLLSIAANSPQEFQPASKKLSSATPFCKRCFKDIVDVSWSSLTSRNIICPSCFEELNPHLRKTKWKGIDLYYLYDYLDPFRNALFTLKGCGDYEMREVLFLKQASVLKYLFHGYQIVPVPSYFLKDEERGFNHVVSIFSLMKLPILDILTKTHDVKQADLSAKKRKEISKYISLRKDISLKGKKILLVDDVFTTGSTLSACLSLLKKGEPKRIKILVLARVRHA